MKLMKISLLLITLVTASLIMISCAANTAVSQVSFDMRLMNNADSTFRAGNYEKAKQKYLQVTDKGQSENARALAQFKLGYLNVYYENPFADYNMALKEFRKFVKKYPSHSKCSEANNFIRIIDQLNKVNEISKENKSLVSGLSDKHNDLVNNLLGMQKAYLRSNAQVDSLKKRIKVLEAVIEEVDKIK